MSVVSAHPEGKIHLNADGYYQAYRKGARKGVGSEKGSCTRRARYESALKWLTGLPAPQPTPDAAPHVVTEVEQLLRQTRPAGKASDPRQQVEAAPRAPVAGYAYLLADEQGRVKIGAATDVLQRRADLQVGNADDLTILGVIPSDDMFALEAALKAEFVAHRVRGEWFSANGAIMRRFGA